MSAESSLQSHSDHVLARIEKFFRSYRPNKMDAEWAQKRHQAVKAEIARREKENQESHQ